jgi:hypothetical protein
MPPALDGQGLYFLKYLLVENILINYAIYTLFKKLLISSIDNISFTALSYNLGLGCFVSKTKPELVLSSSKQENSLIVSSTIFAI